MNSVRVRDEMVFGGRYEIPHPAMYFLIRLKTVAAAAAFTRLTDANAVKRDKIQNRKPAWAKGMGWER